MTSYTTIYEDDVIITSPISFRAHINISEFPQNEFETDENFLVILIYSSLVVVLFKRKKYCNHA